LFITANPLSVQNKRILAPLASQEKNLKSVLFSSGMLSTETALRKPGQGFDQLYGYWELRARLPKGKGLWPAFWLVNESWSYWNEIDVFEVLGDHPQNIYQSTHFKDGGGTEKMSWPEHTYTGIDPTTGFHVYGLLMTVNKLYYYVDGQQTLEVSHRLHDPFYTILSLAVGGDWPGDPDQTTKFPASFEIDYLRIYQKTDRN
jgi:beta-glucanase (GH16 family)